MTAALPAQPADFARAFALLWGARDATGLADLMAEDADFLGLSGQMAEGRKAIAATMAAEFAGSLARSRLVTGKTRLRLIPPAAAVLHQRFVLSGLVDATGRDLGRIGAVLVAVLVAQAEGWHAVSLQFSAVEA